MAECIKGEEFPPSPARFKRLAYPSFDYEESFYRFINREELSDAEYFASQQVGYKCRGLLSEQKAMNEWEKSVKRYQKIEREKGLPPRNQKKVESRVDAGYLAPNGKCYSCYAEYIIERDNIKLS